MAEPCFFPDPQAFRAWLEQHHATEQALQVGYHKRHTGQPSMTWAESVDEALCFGWIDGVRRSIDGNRYMIRFTPRGPRSTWSAVNIDRVAALTSEGRMRTAGLAAFARRAASNSRIYAHEQSEGGRADAEVMAALAAQPLAHEFFMSRPVSYRRSALHWVSSGKREQTRAARLATLMDDCAHLRLLRQFDRARVAPGTVRSERQAP